MKIYDNGVYLEGATNRARFVGLYQNGVEVGSVVYNGVAIQYQGYDVLKITSSYDYTFGLQLQRKDLPNGDYVAVVSYTKDNETKNYEVPIRIELTRATITEYLYELNLT